jgi:outer membrane protein assembly factor BamB
VHRNDSSPGRSRGHGPGGRHRQAPYNGAALRAKTLPRLEHAKGSRPSRGRSSARPWVGLAFVVAFAWTLSGPGVGSATEPGSWPSLQGGPAHPGAVPPPGLPPPLRVAWPARGHPAPAGPLSAAVVGGGIAVANGQSRVVGFDPATGRQLWSAPHARGALTPPAIDPQAGEHGIVVFADGAGGNGGLEAIDLSTTEEIWRLALKAPVFGGPAIEGGRVFVAGQDGLVYAVDVLTGRVVWKVKTPGEADAAPAVSGGMVFAVSEDPATGEGRLFALDAATGKRVWSFSWTYSPPSIGVATSGVTVDGGRVYGGFGDALVRAFDPNTGKVLWSTPVRDGFSPLTTPAVSGGSVFVADRRGDLYRLEASTGDRIWDFQFPALAERGSGSPLVTGSYVFMGSDDGTLAAIEVETGRLAWRTRYAAGPIGPLAPAGDVLLAPVLGSGASIIGLVHDPKGVLVSEESPSTLHLPLALANFAGAFVLVLGAILGAFALLQRSLRRTAPAGPVGEAPGHQPGTESEDEDAADDDLEDEER